MNIVKLFWLNSIEVLLGLVRIYRRSVVKIIRGSEKLLIRISGVHWDLACLGFFHVLGLIILVFVFDDITLLRYLALIILSANHSIVYKFLSFVLFDCGLLSQLLVCAWNWSFLCFIIPIINPRIEKILKLGAQSDQLIYRCFVFGHPILEKFTVSICNLLLKSINLKHFVKPLFDVAKQTSYFISLRWVFTIEKFRICRFLAHMALSLI